MFVNFAIRILVTGTPNVKYIYPWQIPPKTIMILGHRQPKMLNIYPTRSQNPWLPVTQNVKYMYSCQIPTNLFNVGYSGGDVTVRTFSRLCSIPSWTIYPIVQMYPDLLFFDPGIFRWPKMLHICIRVTSPLDPIRTLVTGTSNVKYIYP